MRRGGREVILYNSLVESDQLCRLVLACLGDMKARDVIDLDVRAKTTITDHFIIATSTSSRHALAVSDRVVDAAKENGVRPLGVEGRDAADWILIDLGDVVVHVMQDAARRFYDLEELWRTAI